MVVVEIRTDLLYLIDADGDARAIGLRLPDKIGSALEEVGDDELAGRSG